MSCSAPDAVSVTGVEKALPATHGYLTWLKHRGAPPRRPVLRGITFTVRRGELFGVLGANGAGKSTLMRILAGLIHADRGEVTFAGAPRRARSVGLCTGDERSFYYRLSARSNLTYFGALAGIERRALAQRIEDVARAVDLQSDLDRRFDQFSTGMRQRLSFARALLADPDVLLLDEPTRAIDPVHAHELRRFVRDELVARAGKTVILATNSLEEAWEIGDRLAVLRAGRIAGIAAPAELARQHPDAHRYAIELDRVDTPLLDRVRAVRGVIAVATAASGTGVRLCADITEEPRALTDLLRAVSANGVAVRSIQPQTLRPIDVFTRLTGSLDDAD